MLEHSVGKAPFVCFHAALFFFSHDPLQDVEDADVVDGHKGGEIGGDVDSFDGRSRRVEGLQGLALSHVPPLANKPKGDAQLFGIKKKRNENFSLQKQHFAKFKSTPVPLP